MENFIQINKEMLKPFQKTDTKGNLLVEELSSHEHINHATCMQALTLHSALSLRPLFVYNSDYNDDLVKSYIENSSSVRMPRFCSLLTYVISFFSCLYQLLKFCITRNVLKLKFDGIQYGDIIYDRYLVRHKVGTLDAHNSKTFMNIVKEYIRVVKFHLRVKYIIKAHKIKALLVTHKIGSAGIMARCASKMKIIVYSFTGTDGLCANREFKKIKYYEYEPSAEDIENVKKLPTFDAMFKEVQERQFTGTISADAKNAYNSSNLLYTSREDFCNDYKVDYTKKNIFVMLHAFTDHPHSHFEKMLFNDYADWFLKTLEYAKKHNHVNWFFKRHPSDFRYPTTDINFDEIFTNMPSHVHFIDSKVKLDTRSLGVAADAVITCMGSAGFEMAAFYSIPCLLAGDGTYCKLDFVKAPQTRKEYFIELSNLDKIVKISPEKQKTAQAFYLFIYNYVYIPAIYNISTSNVEATQKSTSYFEKLITLYHMEEQNIRAALAKRIYLLSRKKFFIMRNESYIPYDDYFYFPFSLQNPLPAHAPKVFEEGCKILENAKVKYSLIDGTLLGLYRDKKMIAHDRDIDIAVFDYEDIDNLLYNFYMAGFGIGRYAHRYGKPQQIVFYKDEVVFDIIFYKEYNGMLYTFNEVDLYFTHNAKHFEKLDSLTYNGHNYPIPSNPEEWLARTYGNDWKIPKSSKPENWRDNGGSEYLPSFEYNNNPLTIVPFSFFE